MNTPSGARPARPDAVTVLIAVAGALMLCPGLFALMVCVAAVLKDPDVFAKPFGQALTVYIGLGLVASLGGIAVLWAARRRHRRRAASAP